MSSPVSTVSSSTSMSRSSPRNEKSRSAAGCGVVKIACLLCLLGFVVVTFMSFHDYSQHLRVLSSSMSFVAMSESPTTTATVAATSGSLFVMKQQRQVDPNKLRHQPAAGAPELRGSSSTANTLWPKGDFWNQKTKCRHWGTITTIFPVTKAAEGVAKMDGWCLVVTGDRKGPASYEIPGGTVIFLGTEEQEELAASIPFVAHTPWNHFARKNVAYLYAIANGAEFIWDFDDDNELTKDKGIDNKDVLDAFAKQSAGKQDIVQVMPKGKTSAECQAFNPYPFFQSDAVADNPWPRGYPLDRLQDPNCHLARDEDSCTILKDVSSEAIGIYQSVANHDPDVDGIYRLTRDLPMNFAGAEGGGKPVVIPPGTMAPLNAQAALFHRSAMWSLFLPSTVHGRVSDIWRSYFAQTIGNHYGMLVVFIGPLVDQIRNAHNYLADMNAEQPLYERSGVLIDFLLQWEYKVPDSGERTLPGALERLYADLYETNILEWKDVELVQLWLDSLQAVGYQFPSLPKGRTDPFASLKREPCFPPKKQPTEKQLTKSNATSTARQ